MIYTTDIMYMKGDQLFYICFIYVQQPTRKVKKVSIHRPLELGLGYGLCQSRHL